MQTNLEELRQMTAEKLFEKYKIVKYESDDIFKINKALKLIEKILEKYGKRL